MAPVRRSNKGAILVMVLVGAVLGMAVFTFMYAEGLSYFSTDPKACANCHIMNDQYASWSKGPHHGDARCVDCHLPPDTVAKYFAKALNGYHHSKGFTLQDFHEPILIKPRNAQILQDNCLRCHGDFVHDALIGSWREAHGVNEGVQRVEDGRCVHCHRGVGHGARG